MILKGQEVSLTIRLSALRKTTTCSKTFNSIFDFRPCVNAGMCDAELPDSAMRNTLSIVCTRQYPVITGVLKIGCEGRVI